MHSISIRRHDACNPFAQFTTFRPKKVVEITEPKMGRGSRGKWRLYRFTDEPTPGGSKGPCVVAPVSTVADLIDMCATVAFVNKDSSAHKANTKLGALRATAVMTRRVNGHWRSQTVVIFRTLSGALPSMLHTSSGKYTSPGSYYQIYKSDSEPEDAANKRVVANASIEESLHEAIRMVGSMIHESPDPASLFFKDAVASRLRLFNKSHLSQCPTPFNDIFSSDSTSGSESDSTETSPVARPTGVAGGAPRPLMAPLPPLHLKPWIPSLPPEPPPTTKPGSIAFERPSFENVEELFYSFATHITDPATGRSMELDPLRTAHFRDQAQPLIFCYKLF